MRESNTHFKAFKYRLYPTPAQARQMLLVLKVCRNWYNMCVSERTWAYKLEGRSVTKYEQVKQSRLYRKTFAWAAKSVFSQTMQSVAADVDKAYQAFFRRVKAGEKAGYPRYKGCNRFHSFNFPQYGTGVKIDGRRLKLFGIGRVRVRWHRPVEGTIKTVRIVYKAGRWYAAFACEVETKPELPKTGRVVGIDVGISALLTTSDGDKVENPKFYRKAQVKLRVLQRSLGRKKQGGWREPTQGALARAAPTGTRRQSAPRCLAQAEYVARAGIRLDRRRESARQEYGQKPPPE